MGEGPGRRDREGGARRRGQGRGQEGRAQEGERLRGRGAGPGGKGEGARGREGPRGRGEEPRRGGEGPGGTASAKGPGGQGLNPSNDPPLGNWLEFAGPSCLTSTEGQEPTSLPHNLGPGLEAARGSGQAVSWQHLPRTPEGPFGIQLYRSETFSDKDSNAFSSVREKAKLLATKGPPVPAWNGTHQAQAGSGHGVV